MIENKQEAYSGKQEDRGVSLKARGVSVQGRGESLEARGYPCKQYVNALKKTGSIQCKAGS